MMQTGISIYIGLDNTLEDNLNLIKQAALHGCKKIFTSLHIPEINYANLQQDFTELSQTALEYDMELISDVSPNTLQFLNMAGLDFPKLAKLGITTLRMDFGYSPQQIADYTHNKQNIHIQLNASTIDEAFLAALLKAKADFTKIDALHNFYPREGTGLSEGFFTKQNNLLHSYGIKVGAFLPSLNRPRSPISAGLPTLEVHRTMGFELAARHLIALACDMIFVGDSLPTEAELLALQQLHSTAIQLTLETTRQNKAVLTLLKSCFTTRLDEARDVFRAQESRHLFHDLKIQPENTAEIQVGSVTIDNIKYLRYMGELQISKITKAADSRVNVIGQIPANELFLLDYLTPGRQFKFIIK